jgi:hypothetical protein
MARVTKKDKAKYGITATTNGYPQLELALHKAVKELGWKGLTCHLVCWCNDNQPADAVYSLPYWQKEMPLRKRD